MMPFRGWACACFQKNGEFRLLPLYLTAVVFHGWAAWSDVFVIDVYWDSVFYKHLAFGFSDRFGFDLKNHFPVPPLYPFILSFGVIQGDYLSTELIQSWMNPALYFLGLYPVYALSRLTAGPRTSAAAAFVYGFYPSAIYTQWTMSENLAIPLVLSCFYCAALLVMHDPISKKRMVLTGLLCAAVMLTRMQSIAIVIPLLFWCLWRRRMKRLQLNSTVMAAVFAFGSWLCVLGWLGYFQGEESWMLYSETNSILHDQPFEIILLFLNRFLSLWFALWLEGGLWIPTLALAGFFLYGLLNTGQDAVKKELFLLWFAVSIVITASIAGYRIMRADLETWSVSLRHVSYVNLIAIPLTVPLFGSVQHKLQWRKYSLPAAVISFLLSAVLFLPQVWEGVLRSHTYFTDAPSLDFMYQLTHTEKMKCFLLFAMLSTVLAAAGLRYKAGGFICWAGILLYIYGCSLEFALDDRAFAIKKMEYKNIHDFCSQLEAGRWNQMPIYCMEDHRVKYLVPNLLYWVNRRSQPLEFDAPKPQPPFLYVTFREETEGELVFQSGNLKAYLYK